MSMETGVLIRAEIEEKWMTIDIGDDRIPVEMVIDWMRSRGGFNPFAENLLLAFIQKDQIAHEVPFIVNVGEATYEHQGNHLSVTCHEEGVTIMTACEGDATSCDVPIADVRVYNALIQLISGIQVHYKEQDPNRLPAGIVADKAPPEG